MPQPAVTIFFYRLKIFFVELFEAFLFVFYLIIISHFISIISLPRSSISKFGVINAVNKIQVGFTFTIWAMNDCTNCPIEKELRMGNDFSYEFPSLLPLSSATISKITLVRFRGVKKGLHSLSFILQFLVSLTNLCGRNYDEQLGNDWNIL